MLLRKVNELKFKVLKKNLGVALKNLKTYSILKLVLVKYIIGFLLINYLDKIKKIYIRYCKQVTLNI